MEEDVTGAVDINALGVVVDVDAGASMGGTVAGDPVPDDRGVTAGAVDINALGVVVEIVTISV